jgi:hypothetical protein
LSYVYDVGPTYDYRDRRHDEDDDWVLDDDDGSDHRIWATDLEDAVEMFEVGGG